MWVQSSTLCATWGIYLLMLITQGLMIWEMIYDVSDKGRIHKVEINRSFVVGTKLD